MSIVHQGVIGDHVSPAIKVQITAVQKFGAGILPMKTKTLVSCISSSGLVGVKMNRTIPRTITEDKRLPVVIHPFRGSHHGNMSRTGRA